VQYRAPTVPCSLLQCSADRKLQGATRALALAVFDPGAEFQFRQPVQGPSARRFVSAYRACPPTDCMVSTVLQDAKMFRRKKWKYLILDEAHMIKNWRSQRWQTLLNFNSKRRLLITGARLL